MVVSRYGNDYDDGACGGYAYACAHGDASYDDGDYGDNDDGAYDHDDEYYVNVRLLLAVAKLMASSPSCAGASAQRECHEEFGDHPPCAGASCTAKLSRRVQ